MLKYLLIYNPRSGQAQLLSEFVQAFDPKELRQVEMTRELDLTHVLSQAAHSGIDTLVSAGGDGTVNALVNGLMKLPAEQRLKLAIFPMGTANDFAGTLGLPEQANEFVHLLKSSQTIPVDVVHIRATGFDRYYANVAAGGNSVRVSEEMTDELKANWGAFCYLRGSLQVLRDLDTYHITADCGGERLEDIGTWAVIVANGKTNAGGILVAPNASPTDGLLDVVIIRDGTVLDIVELVSSAVLGSYLDCEQVIYRQVPYLLLHSRPGMRFTMDGEIIAQEPVEFRVVPRAVEMYVGSNFLVGRDDLYSGTNDKD